MNKSTVLKRALAHIALTFPLREPISQQSMRELRGVVGRVRKPVRDKLHTITSAMIKPGLCAAPPVEQCRHDMALFTEEPTINNITLNYILKSNTNSKLIVI